MPLNFELRKNCLSERTLFVRITISKISNAFLRKQKIFACELATASRPKRSEQKELLDEKTIIAFLVALSVILAGCNALFSVGHSNTNTINQTNNKK